MPGVANGGATLTRTKRPKGKGMRQHSGADHHPNPFLSIQFQVLSSPPGTLATFAFQLQRLIKIQNMNTVKVSTSPFFKASCGCIGLAIGSDNWSIVKACDGEREGFELSNPCREFSDDKDYHPLSTEETVELLQTLNTLIGHGYSMISLASRIQFINKKP